MKLLVAALAVVALSAGIAGCTTTQKVMTGGAMGGVTGFALAGPIGGAAGLAVGAVAAPMMSTD